MPIGSARMSLLPFPQWWDGASLTLRFLCLPKGDPQQALKAGLPAFQDANLVFEAELIGSLAHLPLTASATPVGPLVPDAPAGNKPALFALLKDTFNITGVRGPAGAKPRFNKAMTDSYRALIGGRQGSKYLVDSGEFDCAMHQGAQDQADIPPPPPSDAVTWGRVISYALRQPNLARALGLLVQTTVTPAADFYAAGGWLYLGLHATSDYAGEAGIAARYAARIPQLTGDPKSLFAPVLFTVADAPLNFNADDVWREAERYEDGIAKLMHCAQTVDGRDGIRLAWEDEQIAEWLNRQVDVDGAGELVIDSLIGVAGYRVDAREPGGKWSSLAAVKSTGDLMLGPISLGSFDGEAVLEVMPSQLSPKRPGADSPSVRVGKPRLGYPEILYTGGSFADLEADLDALSADPTIQREVGLPDPDVIRLSILVEARALAGDAAQWLPLYETTREFDAGEITIDIEKQDHPTMATLPAVQPGAGPLALPTARDIRLTFTAMGREDAGYFDTPEHRAGAPVMLEVRAAASAEADLFADPADWPALRSFFFQPPPADGSQPAPEERLGAELKLTQSGLTLETPAGSRTVLACSSQLRHTLSPDAGAITFSSAADLVRRWINVVEFDVLRDWTWDGLDPAGIAVTRVIHSRYGDATEPAGVIALPRAIAKKSVPSGQLDPRAAARQTTRLIFFDAFDPKPVAPNFPCEITIDYLLQPVFRDVPAPGPTARSILLPVVTSPRQTPRIVSAGIALSPYERADDYSSTNPRAKSLWFAFAEPPEDPDDAYFVRVLAMGPDPMLLQPGFVPPDIVEDPLPLDPEWMRLILPVQPRDDAGLNAMQGSGQTAKGEAAYLVPIPDHLAETSPELFGFFVYEVRVGHTGSRWCTAQGRFGPMLRIAGVQHPAPPLVCQAARGKTDVLVRAPFATPVLNGANVQPRKPSTELWTLLYARVRQMDGGSSRNVLLTDALMRSPLERNDIEGIGGRVVYGEALISLDFITGVLNRLGLPPDTPLTVLAMEMFANPPEPNPVGTRLGHARILRISPLVPVPDAC